MRKTKIYIDREAKDRIDYIAYLFILCYLIIIARLFYLQVIQGSHYKWLSENNRIRNILIVAPRGKIYDRNGNLLVSNIAGYRLIYLNGKRFTDKILEDLSILLKKDKNEIKKMILKGKILNHTRENLIENDLDEKTAHKILENLNKYSYLDIEVFPKRKYLYDKLASHVIGYAKDINDEEMKQGSYNELDLIGKNGIEKYYNTNLMGKDAHKSIEVNVLNKEVKIVNEEKIVSGNDIYLTLDNKLQSYMTDYLKGEKAAFLAMDAETGEIIVFVSSPEYSLNTLTSKMTDKSWKKILKNPARPLENRCSMGLYPPGSIFKPITALAALYTGIDAKAKIFDPGYFLIGKWKWNDWKLNGHGWIDLKGAMIHSCDTYFYNIADKIGYSPIYYISNMFGIGEKVGIDLPDENKGVLPDNTWKEKTFGMPWYKGDTINCAIGQGYTLVTPLQMLMLYDIIANKGKGYLPHLISGIKKENVIYKIIPTVKYNIDLNKKYFDIIDESLRDVVKKGTGQVLKMGNVEVSAKTGSAENSGYKKTHAWIAGYAPSKHPKIVFVALLEGGGHGGKEAGPIAKKFLDKYFEK